MTLYIQWSVAIDADFRPRYLEITGEAIQEYPREFNGTYVVGTSRATPDHVAVLSSEFSDLIISKIDPTYIAPPAPVEEPEE